MKTPSNLARLKGTKPKKQVPDLVGAKIDVHRRSKADQEMPMADYFAVLPRRRSVEALNDFAKEGAMILHDHLSSNTSAGIFLALHNAATALLAADDAHNKIWKRVVPFAKSPADADDVVEHLIQHLVDQADPGDKRRMEVFATHALFETIAQRLEGAQAKMIDARMMHKTWERVGKEGAW